MKRIFVLICVMCIFMTSCMPATISEKDKKDESIEAEGSENDGEDFEVEEEYVSIDELDFSSGHITGVLRKNFVIDADVPIDYPTECGTYEIVNKELTMSEDEYQQKFRELINEYYGEGASTEYDYEIMDITISSSFYNGNIGYYQRGDYGVYENYHQKISKLLQHIYAEGVEYDKEMIAGVVQGFMESFKEVIPDGVTGNYQCYHINDEFDGYVKTKYASKWSEESWPDDKLEYYAVSLYSEIEDGYFLKIRNPKTYIPIEGEVLDEPAFREHDYIRTAHPQFVELIVSEEGEILSIRIEDYHIIGDMIEKRNIISPKEVLEKFYEQFDGVILENEVIVKSIELEYMTVLEDEWDENNTRNNYLIPMWRVRFDKGDPLLGMYDVSYVFSAIDGEVLKDMRSGY